VGTSTKRGPWKSRRAMYESANGDVGLEEQIWMHENWQPQIRLYRENPSPSSGARRGPLELVKVLLGKLQSFLLIVWSSMILIFST
jgi:hypothetical protein